MDVDWGVDGIRRGGLCKGGDGCGKTTGTEDGFALKGEWIVVRPSRTDDRHEAAQRVTRLAVSSDVVLLFGTPRSLAGFLRGIFPRQVISR